MKNWSLLLGLILLTGCATYESRPLVPAENAAALEARSLNDPQLRSFIETYRNNPLRAWPLSQWGLDDLTMAAFYFHPDLEVARAQWAVAQAGQTSAGERPNPTVGLGLGYNTSTSVISPWIVTPTIDFPIETAGKRGYRIAQAEQLSEAARLNIASVAWQVRSEVRQSFIEFNTAREQESLLRQQQLIEAENLGLLELQYKEGAISAFELTRARLGADEARLALHDAEQRNAAARARLAQAIGVPVHVLDGITFKVEDWEDLPADIPAEDARRRALFNRADILGALAQYAASQSALQLEIARQYPDINLGPGYEYDQGDNKWLLGFSLTLPVFNHNQGAIAEAEARRAEYAARFNALQARVLAQIDIAIAAYRTALNKQTDTDAMLANTASQEKTAWSMFDAGEISRTELAGMRLHTSALKLARLEAVAQAQQAARQLEDALQVPLDLPESAWQSTPKTSEPKETKNRP
ncbi:MAG: TolC family protein [Lysobacterales bacterium]